MKKTYSDWEKDRPILSKILSVDTMSMIIAAIAAFVSYRALDESIRQREATYKPELFLGAVNYLADCSNLNDIKYYQIVSDSIFYKEELRPWYKLYNVGMGAALNVYGCVAFNSELLLKYFSDNNIAGVKVIAENSIKATLVHKQDTITMFKGGPIVDWKVDFVLPIGQQQEEFKQFFPPNVFNDLIKAFLWAIEEKGEGFNSDFHIPIEFGYRDINDKLYKKNFEITINCSLAENNKDWVVCNIHAGSSIEDFVRDFYEMIDEMKSL